VYVPVKTGFTPGPLTQRKRNEQLNVRRRYDGFIEPRALNLLKKSSSVQVQD
jgi:hypothetical protein